MYIHALLPFRMLYILSDILYFFAYKLFGYRVRVTRMNLKNSFPEKTEKQLRQIERQFYHHFCDYFVETMKLLHISDSEMQKRMTFNNIDYVKEVLAKDQSVIMCLGHYGNWEWVTSIALSVNDTNICAGQIYRTLNNKAMDNIFLKIRSRFGTLNIPKNRTLRTIVELGREQKKLLLGFISDQSPARHNIHFWTTFLNQDTAFFTGAEHIAKSTGFAVMYLDIVKTGRGYYECECKMISDKPKEEPEFAITQKYISMLEDTILRAPAYWLWTHRRWKYSKADTSRGA